VYYGLCYVRTKHGTNRIVGHWELSGMYILGRERERARWCSLELFVWKCFLLCVPQVCRRPSVLYLFSVSHIWSYLCSLFSVSHIWSYLCFLFSVSHIWSYLCSSELPKAVPLYLSIYLSICVFGWNRMVSGQKFVTEVPFSNNPFPAHYTTCISLNWPRWYF
jgi:hypothetical protein